MHFFLHIPLTYFPYFLDGPHSNSEILVLKLVLKFYINFLDGLQESGKFGSLFLIFSHVIQVSVNAKFLSFLIEFLSCYIKVTLLKPSRTRPPCCEQNENTIFFTSEKNCIANQNADTNENAYLLFHSENMIFISPFFTAQIFIRVWHKQKYI